MIESYLALRCDYEQVGQALLKQPVCPQCGLKLGEDLDLPPAEDLVERIEEGIAEYLEALRQDGLPQAIHEYAMGLPARNSLAVRMENIASLSEKASPREIMSLFTDEVVAHLNRILSGKTVAPRDLGDLRRALSGRTLTKEEAQRLFRQWLEGQGEEMEDEDILRFEE
jgi:hypothetical protein